MITLYDYEDALWWSENSYEDARDVVQSKNYSPDNRRYQKKTNARMAIDMYNSKRRLQCNRRFVDIFF